MRGLVHGDVRCDDLFLEMYATDASLFQIRPLGVIRKVVLKIMSISRMADLVAAGGRAATQAELVARSAAAGPPEIGTGRAPSG